MNLCLKNKQKKCNVFICKYWTRYIKSRKGFRSFHSSFQQCFNLHRASPVSWCILFPWPCSGEMAHCILAFNSLHSSSRGIPEMMLIYTTPLSWEGKGTCFQSRASKCFLREKNSETDEGRVGGAAVWTKHLGTESSPVSCNPKN